MKQIVSVLLCALLLLSMSACFGVPGVFVNQPENAQPAAETQRPARSTERSRDVATEPPSEPAWWETASQAPARTTELPIETEPVTEPAPTPEIPFYT